MSRFSNSEGRGFHLTFDNGWTISVQFSGGHYCDNKDKSYDWARNRAMDSMPVHSSDAEIAVWSNSGPHNSGLVFLQDDNVRGWTTADEVAQVIHKLRTAKSTLTNKQMTKRLSVIWK